MLPGRMPERRLLGYHKFNISGNGYAQSSGPVSAISWRSRCRRRKCSLTVHVFRSCSAATKLVVGDYSAALDQALTLRMTAKQLFCEPSQLSGASQDHAIVGLEHCSQASRPSSPCP